MSCDENRRKRKAGRRLLIAARPCIRRSQNPGAYKSLVPELTPEDPEAFRQFHFVVHHFEFQGLKSREYAMQFHWLIDKYGSARFSRRPHMVRNLPREAKNIKHDRNFPHDLTRCKNSTPTSEETAERTVDVPRGILLSFFRLVPRNFLFLFNQERT